MPCSAARDFPCPDKQGSATVATSRSSLLHRIRIEPLGWVLIVIIFALIVFLFSHFSHNDGPPTAAEAPTSTSSSAPTAAPAPSAAPAVTPAVQPHASPPPAATAPVTRPSATAVAAPKSHPRHHSGAALQCQVIATVHFTQNSAEPAPGEITSLQQTLPADRSTVRKVEVLGYCDDIGEAKWNFILSRERAQAVAKLVASSFPATAIETEGRGSLDPVGSNQTNNGRAMNRRAVVEVCGR